MPLPTAHGRTAPGARAGGRGRLEIRIGNLGGNAQGSRHALNADTIREKHAAFRRGGRAAIDKVMKQQPAVFLKLLVLLVPRDMRVEHSGGVKAMTDEQIDAAIEAIQAMLEQRAGEGTKVIEGTADTIALPAPDVVPDRPNKVMDAPDTAVGARKRKPRKGKTCAHLSTLSVSRPSGSSLVGGAGARAGDQDGAGEGRERQ